MSLICNLFGHFLTIKRFRDRTLKNGTIFKGRYMLVCKRCEATLEVFEGGSYP